jgi:hydrogenase maturation protein HypF
LRLARQPTRVFPTTSVGRLFDAAAALVGFTGAITFEAQAAIWLEQLARQARDTMPYPFPFDGRELDFRPLLGAVVRDRERGRDPAQIARAFHSGVAHGLAAALGRLTRTHEWEAVAVSGGVFQNQLLLGELAGLLAAESVPLWGNAVVPPNDGGISLGQAALACTSSR